MKLKEKMTQSREKKTFLSLLKQKTVRNNKNEARKIFIISINFFDETRLLSWPIVMMPQWLLLRTIKDEKRNLFFLFRSDWFFFFAFTYSYKDHMCASISVRKHEQQKR